VFEFSEKLAPGLGKIAELTTAPGGVQKKQKGNRDLSAETLKIFEKKNKDSN